MSTTRKHRVLDVQKSQANKGYIHEVNYTLFDYSTLPYTPIKSKIMTRQQAYLLNQDLQGSGFAWSMVDIQVQK